MGRAWPLGNDSWKKLRPISNFEAFEAKLTFQNSQKFPNFYKAYLAQFLSFDHVLGHFGKVLKSYNQCLWSHVILIYQSQVMVFDLKCLFVDFWKWPIMLKLITFCESISWTWNVRMSCRKCPPLQDEHWMGFFWWNMKKLCLGQVIVDFSVVQK